MYVDRKDMKVKWKKIEDIFNNKSDYAYKLAILEADKLVDYALKKMMMQGKDMGERIRFTTSKYPDFRKIWNAHGIRNKIAHEPDFHVSRAMALKALKEFKKALEEIGVL